MTRKEQLDNLCIFLKILHDESKQGHIPCNLMHSAKEYKIPYWQIAISVMIEKGILERKRGKESGKVNYYLWTSQTEPSRHMAEAIVKACKERRYNEKPKTIVIEDINDLEQGLQQAVQLSQFGLMRDEEFEVAMEEVLYMETGIFISLI